MNGAAAQWLCCEVRTQRHLIGHSPGKTSDLDSDCHVTQPSGEPAPALVTMPSLKVTLQVLQDIMVESHDSPSDNCEIASSRYCRRNSEMHSRVKSRKASGV